MVLGAHLHLWHTERLHYAWLQRPQNAVINRTFGFGDFASRAAEAGVDRAGLYPPDPSWTAEDLRDVVEFACGLFGPDRLMFGSDWPVAELGGGYAKVRTELGRVVGELPPSDRDAVLGGTATRFYALRDNGLDHNSPASTGGNDAAVW